MKINNSFKIFLIKAGFLVVLATIFFLFSYQAQAARVEPQKDVPVSGNFDIGPTAFSIVANPGETIRRTVQVTNRKGQEQGFKIQVEDFEGSPNDPSQTIFLQGDRSGRYSARSWFNLELSEFKINHGDRQFFEVTINIPENADAGDHYAGVLVSAPPNKNEKDNSSKTAPNVNITSRVGSLFFIRVKGAVREKGHLEDFKIDRDWYEKTPVDFHIVFKNDGTVRLQPYGKIEIRNSLGKLVETIEIPAFNVLRDSVRKVTNTWEKKDAFGRYSAKLIINPGYGDQVEERNVTLWIIPWKKMVVALLIAIVLILLMFIFKKKFRFKIEIKKDKDDDQNKPSSGTGAGLAPNKSSGPPDPEASHLAQLPRVGGNEYSTPSSHSVPRSEFQVPGVNRHQQLHFSKLNQKTTSQRPVHQQVSHVTIQQNSPPQKNQFYSRQSDFAGSSDVGLPARTSQTKDPPFAPWDSRNRLGQIQNDHQHGQKKRRVL